MAIIMIVVVIVIIGVIVSDVCPSIRERVIRTKKQLPALPDGWMDGLGRMDG